MKRVFLVPVDRAQRLRMALEVIGLVVMLVLAVSVLLTGLTAVT